MATNSTATNCCTEQNNETSKSTDDDDIYLAKKPGYQKGHKPINAGCPYKKILYVNIINIINIIC